jgi:hypothetical protein
MADIKVKYGAAGEALTITLASLAQAAARSSLAVDNTTNLFLDALVQLQIELAAGTPGSDKAVYVYAYGTVSSATEDWGDTEIDGTDKAITMDDPPNLRLMGAINAPTSAGVFESVPMSVAAAFGGVLPRKWGIVVHNQTNIAFHATEGNHLKRYQGILGQSV